MSVSVAQLPLFLKARTRPNSAVGIHLNLQSRSDFKVVVVRVFTCLRLRAAAGNRDTAMLNNKEAELSELSLFFIGQNR